MRPLGRTVVTALLGVFWLVLLPGNVAAASNAPNTPRLSERAPGSGSAQNPCQVSQGDPDFSNVTDILCGRRYLMRIDDVVVVNVNEGLATTVIAPTSNSQMGEPTFELAFTVSDPNPAFSSPVSQGQDVAPIALGRMVNLPRDIIVHLLLGTDGKWHLLVTDPQRNVEIAVVVPTSIQPASQGQSEQAVVLADFDGDGYVEALIGYLGVDQQGQLQSGMRIVKAVDVNDLSRGVTFGPEMTSTKLGLPLSTLKTGDVNGDGLPEILSFDGTTLSVFTADPTTLQISLATTVSLPANAFVFPFNLIAGRFRDTPFDDVVVAGQLQGGPAGVTLYSISGDPNLNLQPVTGQFFSIVPPFNYPVVQVFLAKGPLTDWFSGQDLLVVGAASAITGLVYIFSSDQNLNLAQVSQTQVTTSTDQGGFGCLYGLAVGNFDNLQTDPLGRVQHNPALQIATLWRAARAFAPPRFFCSQVNDNQFNPAVRLWSVTVPPPNQQSSDWLTLLQDLEPFGTVHPTTGLVLAVGDTQGRALVLGAPETVTVLGDLRADIVLGIPPMHIDWIDPVTPLDPTQFPGCNQPPAPCQLNLTVMPSVPSPSIGFNTQYAFTSSTDSNANRQSTTSWSLGVKLTQEESITFGFPDLDAVSVDITRSAGYTHDGTVKKIFDTYQGITNSLTVTTGFADHVFLTQRHQHTYYYPVIGHTACQSGTSGNCPKGPLYVVFSGPDNIVPGEVDASTLEWYQPPQEPGNVFTYPWDLDRLGQAFPGLTPLTANPAEWRGTGSAQTTYSTTWAGTTKQSNSSGSVNSETFSLSISVSSVVDTGDLVSGGTNTEFDLNQSASVSTLNTLTQTLSASSGIQVNKPVFPSPVGNNYQYYFGGYVFGLTTPNTLQQPCPASNPPPGCIALTDQSGNGIDIPATGPLIVGFVAKPQDPFTDQPLPWWPQVYNKPDVGLNHPERWDWSRSTQTASFNSAQGPGVPAQDQGFYRMKGFFITPAGANGSGPNRTTATAGDQLLLTARIYNFSLTDTDDPTPPLVPAAAVHVRFHGQRYDPGSGTLVGDAFLIGESLIGSIIGFNPLTTQSGRANWELTSVPFDTTPYAGVNLVFWVVVWMEDAQGNLVPEIPDHGLNANPASMTFAQITDVPVQSYSNNVGLYGWSGAGFYVAPPPSASADRAPSGRTEGREARGRGRERAGVASELTVAGLSVPDAPVPVDKKTRITAQLLAHATSLDAVPVLFYDGDPEKNGRLFDFQQVPRVPADEPLLVRTFFRPDTCGPHTVVVVAGPPAAQSRSAAEVKVTIDPVEATQALMATASRLDLAPSLKDRLLRDLRSVVGTFEAGRLHQGIQEIRNITWKVGRFRGTEISDADAERLIGQVLFATQCLQRTGH